jgi:hypothetical protein
MTILAGSHGQLWISGELAARCTSWQLDTEREFSDRTPIYHWRQRSRPLRTTTTGSATILYDPSQPITASLLAAVSDDEPAPVDLLLYTDRTAASGYQLSAFVSLMATAVKPKSAAVGRITFQATGPIVTL